VTIRARGGPKELITGKYSRAESPYYEFCHLQHSTLPVADPLTSVTSNLCLQGVVDLTTSVSPTSVNTIAERSATEPAQKQIQALRAIAVSSVVLYHLWPNRLTGGYVGVDAFFVISGFLMTRTLVNVRLRSDSIRDVFREFYARRLRRILPAALVTLLLCSIVILTMTTPIEWLSNLREIFASTFFYENWMLASRATNYLAAASGASPVQHFWSLSVEEQFYLVWPAVIYFAVPRRFTSAKSGMIRLSWVLSTIAVVSLIYCIYQTDANSATAYFDTAARVWEFAVGGLVYLVMQNLSIPGPVRAMAGWCGLLLLAYAIASFSGNTVFPGWHASVPVVGTALVLLNSRESSFWGPYRILALRPLQWIGDISYSIYLVHWPILILFSEVTNGGATLPGKTRLALLAPILALSIGLKRWVEDPLRRRHKTGDEGRARASLTPRRVISMILVTQLVVAGLSFYGWRHVASQAADARAQLTSFRNSPPHCFGARVEDASSGCSSNGLASSIVIPDPLVAADDFPFGRCQQSFTSADIRSCNLVTGHVDSVFVIGDSHVTQWLPAILPWAESKRLNVTTLLKSACAFTQKSPVASCKAWNERVDAMVSAERPKYIITSAESGSGDATQGMLSQAASGMALSWQQATRAGTAVLAIRDIPQPVAAGIDSIPQCLYRKHTYAACSFSQQRGLRDDLVQLAGRIVPSARVTDFGSAFCPKLVCQPVIGNTLVYLDGTHMTATFALSLTRTFSDAFDRALAGKP
jgi:peptidoglycan/LPS O-acetylase OafA/YrhL